MVLDESYYAAKFAYILVKKWESKKDNKDKNVKRRLN